MMITSLKILLSETIKNYPKLFAILIIALVLETIVLLSSIITIIPLVEYVLDPSLSSPNKFTEIVIMFLNFLGIKIGYFSFGFLFVFTNILRAIFAMFLLKIILTIKYNITKSLRLSLMDDILSAKWKFFNELGYGKLLNTLDQVLIKVSDIIKHLAGVIPTVLQIFMLLIIPFFINFKLTLLTLLISVLVAAPFKFFNKFSHRLGLDEVQKQNYILSILNETIQSAKIILGYGKKKITLKKLENATDDFNEIVIKKELLSEITHYLFKPIAILGVIISIGFSIDSQTDLSKLAGVFWSLYSAIPLIAKLIKMSLAVNNFLPNYDQLNNLRQKAKSNFEKNGDKKFKELNSHIYFKNINFSYDKRDEILENINLKIKKNFITSIVGKSGIGKSTLVDLILSLNSPTQGKIYLDNDSIEDFDLDSYRSKIGYVPQESILFNDTIKNNLLWANEAASDGEIKDALLKVNAYNFINKLPNKLNTVVGEKGSELSGGERQRIALARALVRKPNIIVLDEATSSVDKESENIIRDTLKKISKYTTVIIIAHKSTLVEASDYIYLIKDKSIREEGDFNQLKKNKNSEFYLLYG